MHRVLQLPDLALHGLLLEPLAVIVRLELFEGGLLADRLRLVVRSHRPSLRWLAKVLLH